MGTRRLLVTDIDGTLVGDSQALDRFADWHAAQRDRWCLAYATGRSRESLQRLVSETSLPSPDVLIASVGTEVYERDGAPWPGWGERFAAWDADQARGALAPIKRLQPQPVANQTRLKASFFAPDLAQADLALVRAALDDAGVDANVVYSSSLNLDVMPAGSGKGEATAVVARTLGLTASDVLVFGDSGNDLQLFQRGFRGTVVANAEADLMAAIDHAVYRSPSSHADGVLDGIRHWSRRRPDSSAGQGPGPRPPEPALVQSSHPTQTAPPARR